MGSGFLLVPNSVLTRKPTADSGARRFYRAASIVSISISSLNTIRTAFSPIFQNSWNRSTMSTISTFSLRAWGALVYTWASSCPIADAVYDEGGVR